MLPKQDGKYLGYGDPDKHGRCQMDLHPGTYSCGCVTVDQNVAGNDECWKRLREITEKVKCDDPN